MNGPALCLIQQIIKSPRLEGYLFYAAAVRSCASTELHARAIKVTERAIKRNKVASI